MLAVESTAPPTPSFPRALLLPLLTTVGSSCWASLHAPPEHVEKGWPQPRVVAHVNVAKRFDRYKLTNGAYHLAARGPCIACVCSCPPRHHLLVATTLSSPFGATVL